MANWSSTCINLHGDERQISLALVNIKKYTKDDYFWRGIPKGLPDTIDYRAGYSGMQVDEIRYEKKSSEFTIIGQGRWCAPHKYIEQIAKRYKLSGDYSDEEAGCNFFHIMEFKNGKKTNDVEDEYFSQLSIDYNGIEDYVDNYHWIAEEKDWEQNNDEMLKLFANNGYTLEDLKKEWSL